MIYIINRAGTTISAISSPIYEGSVGVNTITLFAPYPANTQILISALLPNGVPVKNLYPMSNVFVPVDMKDDNGNAYNVFQCEIDENLTTLPGTVQLYFSLMSGIGKKLNSYTTAFTVSGGNFRIEDVVVPSDGIYIEKVLEYLAELNSDPVKSVVYASPNGIQPPTSVSVYPTGFNSFISNGFTPEGTTEFINSNNDVFFLVTSLNGNARVGFNLDLLGIFNIRLIQLYMMSGTSDIDITVEYGINELELQSISYTVNSTAYAVNIIPRVFVEAQARYLRITFNQPVIVKGVQIFKPSADAKYIITQKSGAQSVINYLSPVVDNALSTTSTNPVQNKVITAALNGKQNQLTFDSSPTYGSENPVTSNGIWVMNEETRQELRSAIENIAIPNIYYETTFTMAIGAVFTYSYIKPNDIIIITSTGSPDLVVFNASGQAGAGATIITQADFENGIVPTPQSGDRFIIGNTGLGVICLESGIIQPNIVVDNALSDTSENPVQNKVIAQAIGDIDTALDSIIAIQNSLIGGGSV